MENNVNWQQLIDELAVKLGTTSEYLWGVMVHGERVSGLIWAIISGLVLIFCCFWSY